MLNPRWHDPETIEEFARRDTDHRLLQLIDAEQDAGSLAVLDLGCAAGRNTVYLANKGADIHAVDLSLPMVEATRERLAPILGAAEAERRVKQSAMDELSMFDDESFDLVVALGIYQQATTLPEWDRALAETARVLRKGGRLLVAVFAPGTDLTGEDGASVDGEPHVFVIREGMRAVLYSASELDAYLSKLGFAPLIATETVERPHDPAGNRITVNALYQKER